MLYTDDDLIGADPATRARLIERFRESSQVVPVADATAAATLVTAVSGWFTPSTSDPLYVYRQDIDAVVVTEDGSTWWPVATRTRGAVCSLSNSVLTNTVSVMVPTLSKHSGGFSLGLTSSYSLMVPATGVYLVHAAASISGTTPAGGRGFIQVMVNDSATASARFNAYNEARVAGTAVLELTSGDGVKIETYHNAGDTRTVSGTLRVVSMPAPMW